ncbi:MAG: winged helix-turn-helix transcriptional regulator [Actinobacteria bacterium]|nr:winged helix-turn-helix transcriptional regulator [Actinomycetota bacterium]
MDPAPARRPATDAEARALASSLRLRILRLCVDEDLTNKQVSDRLGIDPGSALHHIRTLVATGFLAAQPPRRGRRGARERPYRATGKSWYLDTGHAGSALAAATGAFADELSEVDPGRVSWVRAPFRLHEDDRNALWRDLEALVGRYLERERPDGQPYAVFAAVYPRIPARGAPAGGTADDA